MSALKRLVAVVGLEAGAFVGGWAIATPGDQFVFAMLGGIALVFGIVWALGGFE